MLVYLYFVNGVNAGRELVCEEHEAKSILRKHYVLELVGTRYVLAKKRPASRREREELLAKHMRTRYAQHTPQTWGWWDPSNWDGLRFIG